MEEDFYLLDLAQNVLWKDCTLHWLLKVFFFVKALYEMSYLAVMVVMFVFYQDGDKEID